MVTPSLVLLFSPISIFEARSLGVAMASASLLNASTLSRSLFPVKLSRIGCVSSAGRSVSSMNQLRLKPMAVRAQVRRAVSTKEEEIATESDMQFESPLRIVEYPDPRLRARNKRIETFDENLKKLVEEMFDVMYKTDGVGLAAPQVGVNVQLMVFNPEGEKGEGEEVVLVNPKVYKSSQKLVPFEEGCLSFPEIYAAVKRPESIKIDARDITGAKFSVNLSGFPARVFQHEFDHLQGVLFFDRMSDEVLASILPQLQALEKKYEEKTGLPSPEKAQPRTRTIVAGFGQS